MDWNSRAREVVLKAMVNAKHEPWNIQRDLDQALSELASIVEEEIIGKDELQGMYTPLQWEIAQDRNALRAKQRDQLSNRSSDNG